MLIRYDYVSISYHYHTSIIVSVIVIIIIVIVVFWKITKWTTRFQKEAQGSTAQ